MGVPVHLVGVRASFPHLDAPHAAVANAKPRYGITLLVPDGHPALQAVPQAIQQCIAEKWPSGAPYNLETKWATFTDGRQPQGKKQITYPGFWILRAYSEEKVPVGVARATAQSQSDTAASLAIAHSEVTRLGADQTMDVKVIYSGCWVWAGIDIYAYERPKPGLAVGLNGVMFLCHGDRLDGRPTFEAMFGGAAAAPGTPPPLAPTTAPAPGPVAPTGVPGLGAPAAAPAAPGVPGLVPPAAAPAESPGPVTGGAGAPWTPPQ